MTGLYWDHPGTRIAEYAASSRGEKAVLTVKLAISDPLELGYLLRQLAEAKGREQAGPKVKRPARPLLLEHKPGRLLAAGLLMLGLLVAPRPAAAGDPWNGARAFWQQARSHEPAPRWRSRIPLPPDVRRLRALIHRAAERHGLPARLIAGVIRVESGGNCRARSRAGARGAMQVLPATARGVGVGGSLYDCATGIEAGTRYLARIVRRHGTGCSALSLYERGEAAQPRCTAYGRRVLAATGRAS